VTAGLATGPNALIRDGAHTILGAQDALDVACGAGVRQAPGPRDESELEPRLRAVLDAVRTGRDTAAVLARTRAEARAALAALAELELRGYLTRAPGGRYEVRA
jgi:predicted Rossmann fold nucleotide-binding protein DprA/Smf involved in DNA uptake